MVITKDGHKIKSYSIAFTYGFNPRTGKVEPCRDTAKFINDSGMDCYKSYDECKKVCDQRNKKQTA